MTMTVILWHVSMFIQGNPSYRKHRTKIINKSTFFKEKLSNSACLSEELFYVIADFSACYMFLLHFVELVHDYAEILIFFV